MAGWNLASVWEAIADRFPTTPALIHDSVETTWADFDRRADGVGLALLDAGLERQAKVAQLLFNGPEYLEALFGCFKVGMVPVNTNYRYTGPELADLWRNADVEAVVFHGDLADRCEAVLDQVPAVRTWLWVDAGTGPCPKWATPYEAAAARSGRRTVAPWGRSGDDLFLLYTGGTTGQPKGVMWPQDTLFHMLEEANGRSWPVQADPASLAAALTKPGARVLPAPPLMHGTAMWFAMPAISSGGSVVTVGDRRFEPTSLLDAIARHRVKGLCIVGDAFGRPIADALEAHPGRWDLSSVRVVVSSGVMFNHATKGRILAHLPNATIVDGLGTSESGTMGQSLMKRGDAVATASFRVGPSTRVVDDEGSDVEPGSGHRGRLAVAGRIPVGYYGDPKKTAETFVTIGGVLHVVAGDVAEVESDGSIRLLGRGSICINTGGEKVFPEEVEEVIKNFPGVHDAVVVGVPDARFGEAVAAVVEWAPDATPDVHALDDALRSTLAGYKVPRRFVAHPIERAANGKADYRRLAAVAAQNGPTEKP